MNNHSTGIQAEQSVTGLQPEKPIPPWRSPDCPPLTCEPHRGTLLKWMSVTCLLTGLLAVLPIPIGVLGIPFCLATRRMGRRDLAKIKEGRMDRGGEIAAIEAEVVGEFGFWFGLLNVLICAVFILPNLLF